MNLRAWSKSNVEYTRKLVNSALEGARSGEQGFLQGRPVTPFLNQSIRNSLLPAALGVCIGFLGWYPGTRHKSVKRALVGGIFGCATGFAVGFAWESRRLAASVASAALQKVSKVRDEHWLEQNPIDYA